MTTRLLIDGDVVAFKAAAACQTICYDHDLVFPVASKSVAELLASNIMASLKADFSATEATVILSDPEDNWRYEVDPTYKRNRVGEKPLLLAYLKAWLRKEHGAFHWPRLEADDTISLMATAPYEDTWGESPEGRKELVTRGPAPDTIIVGKDKDFKSIPGQHHQLDADINPATRMRTTRDVTQWEADRFHLMQTLAGDRVDGFYGCPGIALKRAGDIIDDPKLLVPQEGVKTRGVNKGESVTRWMSEPTNDYWACIVSHYKKAGLGEREALVTARLSRLLRHGEYDHETHEVTLWTPDKITVRR